MKFDLIPLPGAPGVDFLIRTQFWSTLAHWYIYQVWLKSDENCKRSRRRTNDNRQSEIGKAHFRLRLMWAKKTQDLVTTSKFIRPIMTFPLTITLLVCWDTLMAMTFKFTTSAVTWINRNIQQLHINLPYMNLSV